MIGAPEEVECPNCKQPVGTYYDDYDIDMRANVDTATWELMSHCPECDHGWATIYVVTLRERP
jgi:hypothetical protein